MPCHHLCVTMCLGVYHIHRYVLSILGDMYVLHSFSAYLNIDFQLKEIILNHT